MLYDPLNSVSNLTMDALDDVLDKQLTSPGVTRNFLNIWNTKPACSDKNRSKY